MATKYLDLSGGNDANDGSSFANRKKTFASMSGVAAAGDTIRVMKTADPVSLGINATFTDNSSTVTLASALTANIELCESGWTAGTGVTITYSTTNKEGTYAVSCALGGTYVTGTLVAYKTLSSTDFSAYKQISAWIKCSATTAAGDWEIRLCSDTAGVTAVDTWSIPALLTTGFAPLTYDKAAALGSAIQSVAIYRIAGSGTPTFVVDNILACKDSTSADCLTLSHLIGKNVAPSNTTSNVKEWFQIKSINGTTLKLDLYGDATPGLAATPYYTTETVTAYTILPYTLTAASTFATPVGTIAGGDVTIQGGYNTSDMTSVTGDTYIRYPGSATNICQTTGTRQVWSNMHWIGAATLMTISGSQIFTNCGFYGAGSLIADARNTTLGNNKFDSCYFQGSQGGLGIGGGAHYFTNCRFNTARNACFNLTGQGMLFDKCFAAGIIGAFGAIMINDASVTGGTGNGNVFRNCEFRNNYADVAFYGGVNYFDNCIFGSSTEQQYLGGVGQNAMILSTNHDQTADNHQQWHDNTGKIISDSSTRHTASGISWKFSPTSTTRTSTYPLRLKVATIYCSASTLVTVKGWFRRSNTGLTMSLYVRDGQLGGPSTAQTTSMAAAADTWEELTVSWTPTSAGVVEIEALGYGGTTYNGWVDDLTITQA